MVVLETSHNLYLNLSPHCPLFRALRTLRRFEAFENFLSASINSIQCLMVKYIASILQSVVFYIKSRMTGKLQKMLKKLFLWKLCHELFKECSRFRASKIQEKTSRERPKSAPYLRLKNSKRTSMCQVFSSTKPT